MCSCQILKESRKGRALGRPELDGSGPPAQGTCRLAGRQELSRFQELIFEDFARFILVENTYEEVVLQTVMKDILQGQCRRTLGRAAAELGGAALLCGPC